MATGGTLPVMKTQTISLYNTTGIIEREKNIYYSPLMKSGSATPIKYRWLGLFQQMCNSPVDYTDITISIWSPEDRTLKVRGNIDDFRVVTEHGLALNYLILKRDIYSGESTIEDRIYYAFFITDVKQAGQGSIQLTLEPDHFTNVFYLHNNDTFLSGEGYYDAFNGKLKNCYVERQHYNRVKLKPLVIQNEEMNPSPIVDIEDNHEVALFDITQIVGENLNPEIISIDSLVGLYTTGSGTLFPINLSTVTNQKIINLNGTWYIKLDFNFSTQNYNVTFNKIGYTLRLYETVEDNLPIFSQIEESFKYKRQFRDYKEWLNYGDTFTEIEKATIENESNFSNLSDYLKVKIQKHCLYFIYLSLSKDSNLIRFYKDGYKQRPLHTNIENSDIDRQLTTVVIPICIVPDWLNKFYQEINDLMIGVNRTVDTGHNFYCEDSDDNEYVLNNYQPIETNVFSFTIGNPRIINRLINQNSPYSEDIIGAYISRESALRKWIIFNPNKPLDFNCNINTIYDKDSRRIYKEEPQLVFMAVGSITTKDEITNYETIRRKVVEGNDYISFIVGQNNQLKLNYFSQSPVGDLLACFILEKDKVEFDINLSSKNIPDLKNNFFDTVLDFPPYTFYSVSLLGNIESVFDRKNYYENEIVKCELTVSATSTFNINFIPTYKINDKNIKYYSEGLRQTLTNDLTILSSKLIEYLVSNRAQMKNQFAVNDISHGTQLVNDSLQSWGADIPNAGAKGSMTGGTAGAIVGAVSKAVEWTWGMVTGAINWDKDRQIIEMNQKAKLSDMGASPSNVKQVGTDIDIDLSTQEYGLYINHYRIDEVSYNSICKYLERFGYTVNIYDSLNVTSRVGWDYIKLISFDYNSTINIQQEESIRQIFAEGVTLLHNKTYLIQGHNYETILEEVI